MLWLFQLPHGHIMLTVSGTLHVQLVSFLLRPCSNTEDRRWAHPGRFHVFGHLVFCMDGLQHHHNALHWGVTLGTLDWSYQWSVDVIISVVNVNQEYCHHLLALKVLVCCRVLHSAEGRSVGSTSKNTAEWYSAASSGSYWPIGRWIIILILAIKIKHKYNTKGSP
jgi:hypothetical protein